MGQPARILLVEDDALIAMDFEDELTDQGYDVVCASNVAKAQKILSEETPSLVILDMHLKSETTFTIAQDLLSKQVPFFFLSGNDVSALPPDLATSTLLTKPVQMDQVLAEISASLTRAG